ncbi:hypothetical protein D9611_005774 [Ephemerocybe angulata]|uniref:WW domain-containing protein n=1 Tax=Ephemerocybe angulata TaxID=980116 RepID=A0A8H5BIG7_9AGAR|nr:hypothetical protein D9611_005774 [Tulosesus angulatus]
MTSIINGMNLPAGWLEQYDPGTNRKFYVDTNVEPARVTWVHPYENEQYLAEHPQSLRNIKQSIAATNGSDPSPEIDRRRSFAGTSSAPVIEPVEWNGRPPYKQGFLEKLKDKAINSIEARDARKRQQAEAWQQGPDNGYPGRNAARPPHLPEYATQYPAQYPPQTYAQAYPGSGMGMGMGRRHGGFSGGSALPILGGFAGGMLLGDMLDGGLGGGGFGGGGFDGGGFGGGFDGGGFGGF